MEELQGHRKFSLQKIVEVSDFNLNRVRFEWQKIWSEFYEVFCYAGSHSNQRVSMYAIDSLRQLAVKFLEREELSNFQFQSKFLIPFEEIMEKNKDTSIREFIV